MPRFWHAGRRDRPETAPFASAEAGTTALAWRIGRGRPIIVALRRGSRPLMPLRHRTHVVLAGALAALALLLSPPSVRADEDEGDIPDFVRQHPHPGIDLDPGFRYDAHLQQRLEAAVQSMGLGDLARQGRCGIAVVDLADPTRPVLAEVRGGDMIYAASVPKIAVLYAAFQARKERRLVIDDAFRETLTQMCRVSSNTAASEAIQKLGFPYIASVLWASGLYDPDMGGLWVGKAYGGKNDYWVRDPIANLSHGATAVSLAKLLTLLAQGRLVDAQSSREMLEILGDPGLHHKFVKGLDSRPSTIYRKSGSWSEWHGDAAIIERDDKRYVAVALLQSTDGNAILQELILKLDDCVTSCPPRSRVLLTSAAGAGDVATR